MCEPTPDQFAALITLVDEIRSVPLAHLPVAVYLIRHGYVGEHGMPRQEIAEIAGLLDRAPKTVTDSLRALVRKGAVLRLVDDGTRYAFNPRWKVIR